MFKENTITKLLLSLCFLGAITNALALPSDKEQPIKVLSEHALLDDLKGVTVYSGNVQISQGTLQINAEKVTIYSSAKGVDKIVAEGSPAHYQQQAKQGESLVHAYGKTIHYVAPEEQLMIIEDAELQQDSNTFHGHRITYDIAKQQVNASGGVEQSIDQDNRVQIIIQPAKNPKNE